MKKSEREQPQTQKSFEGATVILLTSLVTLLLFAYLLAAMLRPQWFQ